MAMRRAAFAQFGDRLLHVALGFRIERRGRFVEQDDGRVLDQRARDGDALALAAGKLQAVLADRGVVADRKAFDEIVRVGGLCRGDDFLFAGAELAERDVVADRAAEQVHDLAHIGDVLAQRAARDRGDVLAVDQDASRIDIVEAQDQVEHRGLAAARRRRQAR